MANIQREHRLIDSNKKGFYKYVGILDTELANNVLIDVSTLAFALNANGKIMTSNTDPKQSYRIQVQRVWGTVGIPNGYLSLQWETTTPGTANQEMAVITSEYFDFNMTDISGLGGNLFNPETNLANTSGNILISTKGVTANSNYTLFFQITKEPADYDQGQTADPIAFNRNWAL